jgi:hypothetical protein
MQTEQPQPQQKPQQANTNPEVQTKVWAKKLNLK